MTTVVTDIVDVYVFRRLNARVQFLLLQRRNDVPMAQTWQGFHHEIAAGARASDVARQAVEDLAGLSIDRFYSADFVNQFYDEARDAVVLAPVLAVTVSDRSSVDLSEDFQDAGWFDRDEATAQRCPENGRRAVASSRSNQPASWKSSERSTDERSLTVTASTGARTTASRASS